MAWLTPCKSYIAPDARQVSEWNRKVNHVHTEGEGSLHPISAVNKADDSVCKSIDLILVVLSTSATEVLQGDISFETLINVSRE